MATIYDLEADEQIAQISKKFSNYTRYYRDGEDDAGEYVDNCEVLLQNLVNCAKSRIEAFVTDSSMALPEMDLHAYQDMYEKIEEALVNASANNL